MNQVIVAPPPLHPLGTFATRTLSLAVGDLLPPVQGEAIAHLVIRQVHACVRPSQIESTIVTWFDCLLHIHPGMPSRMHHRKITMGNTSDPNPTKRLERTCFPQTILLVM
jgi:hypothetical protein